METAKSFSQYAWSGRGVNQAHLECESQRDKVKDCAGQAYRMLVRTLLQARSDSTDESEAGAWEKEFMTNAQIGRFLFACSLFNYALSAIDTIYSRMKG
jgi:hypothetical protein